MGFLPFDDLDFREKDAGAENNGMLMGTIRRWEGKSCLVLSASILSGCRGSG
ncbi:MAG: hypothetical protein IJL96_05625 [Clostridia bacterium]|jgi:hypothetical protein|nr:hypothetical protein [Clostridia bacterium]